MAELEAATDWLCLAKDAFTPQRCLKRSGHDGEHRGWIDREREQAATIERLRLGWETVRDEVAKTMGWRRARASGVMVTATDTSDFCGLPPSSLKLLDRLARAALTGSET